MSDGTGMGEDYWLEKTYCPRKDCHKAHSCPDILTAETATLIYSIYGTKNPPLKFKEITPECFRNG